MTITLPASLTHQSTTTLAGYDYAYDNMGRITSIVSSVEGTSTFTYDKTSQLTGADHASPRADETYTYDDNGNRTMTGYTVTGNNLTTSDGTYDYEYDDEGNRTKRTEISTGDYEVYEWDHRNRLISVTFYDSMDTELKSVDHTYDIFNRWIRRTTDPDGPGSASAIDTFFAYDGIEPILQFDGPADTDLTNRNLFGPAADQILASESVTSLTSAGNAVWALSDHLGTPRDIADQNESTHTTTVTNHRTYDSFGNRTAETNAAVDLIFGFTGKAFDEHTGLGNHWNRWFTSDLDQWLSQDLIGFAGGDMNLRRYVHNASTRYIDSNGLNEDLPLIPLVDESGNPVAHFDPNIYVREMTRPRSIFSPLDPNHTPWIVYPPAPPVPRTPQIGAMPPDVARRFDQQMLRIEHCMAFLRDHQIPNYWRVGNFTNQEVDALYWAIRYAEANRHANERLEALDNALPIPNPVAGGARAMASRVRRPRPVPRFSTVAEYARNQAIDPSRNVRFISFPDGRTVHLGPTLDRIASGGSHPHRHDGTVFENRPPRGTTTPLLPVRRYGYYGEFVHPTPGDPGAGRQRVVIGLGGEAYYTPDHYKTFITIQDPFMTTTGVRSP